MKDCSMARRTLFVRFIVLSAILFGLLSLTSCDMIEDLLATSDEPGTIYGYVVMEDNASRTNVSVTATNSDGTLTYTTTTDKNGYYCIEQVTPAKYTLTFKKTAYADAQKSITLRGGKNADAGTVTLYISYGYIKGKVTDTDGKPISKATVTISNSSSKYSAVSDTKGNYSIKAKQGTYTEIKFDCTCWSTQSMSLGSNKITVSANKTVTVSDYKLTAHHNFESAGVDPKTGKKINRCSVCGVETPVTGALWAGVRVSSYGMVADESDPYAFEEFPNVDEMTSFGQTMSSLYEGSTGAYLLIVGTMSSNNTCSLAFPITGTYDHIKGSSKDKYESYLDAMDDAGYSVWLQVESGDADLETLVELVMNRYGHHSCVKGFGIDVEWHFPVEGSDRGTKLSDTDAQKVLAKVRTYNENYTVFVKHWREDYLPSKMEGLIYVNDSQQFHSLDDVKEDFSDWAAYYAPYPVMFQIGYKADRPIWNEFDNPLKEFGEAILEACTSGNDIGIIWVDFTLCDALKKVPTT